MPPDTDLGAPPDKPGIKEWVTEHKGIAIGGAVALAVGVYILLRSKKSASSSSASSGTNQTGTPATVYPTSSGITGDTNQGDYYAGILNQLNSNSSALSSQLTGIGTSLTSAIDAITATGNPSTAPTNTGSPSAAAAPAPATPSYQHVNLPGIGEADVLGIIGAGGAYGGYNVGGGAPVYFGNINSASQGPQYEKAGNYVYTPVQYEGLISAGNPGEHLGNG